MPVYVFLCSKCGNRCEDYRSISKRDEEMICLMCGEKMDRCIGEGAIINLKGKGWYKGGMQ